MSCSSHGTAARRPSDLTYRAKLPLIAVAYPRAAPLDLARSKNSAGELPTPISSPPATGAPTETCVAAPLMGAQDVRAQALGSEVPFLQAETCGLTASRVAPFAPWQYEKGGPERGMPECQGYVAAVFTDAVAETGRRVLQEPARTRQDRTREIGTGLDPYRAICGETARTRPGCSNAERVFAALGRPRTR